MSNITFQCVISESTSIWSCCSKKEERLKISCFPDDPLYLFRCQTPKQAAEFAPLNGKELPPLETKCCRAILPRFIEMSLLIDGQMQRKEINLKSFAKRLTVAKGDSVTPQEVYQACSDKRFIEFLAEIGDCAKKRVGLPTDSRFQSLSDQDLSLDSLNSKSGGGSPSQRQRGRWRSTDSQQNGSGSIGRSPQTSSEFLADMPLIHSWMEQLTPTLLPEATIESIIPFLKDNWRKWKEECDQKNIPSLFFPAADGRKLDVEYFQDGDIFVYYVDDDGAPVGVDLSGKVANPQWKEIRHLQQFVIYHTCAQAEFQKTPGILRIYKTSQYPDENRFHVLHERYKNSLQDFFLNKEERGSPISSLNGSFRNGSHRRSKSTLKGRRPLTLKAKVKIAEDLLTGLARLHHAEIAHFSIQPSNLFIDPKKDFEAEAVIGGFEFARVIDPSLDKTILPAAMKAPFLAPELESNPLYQNRITIFTKAPLACDVYSLGQCLKLLFNIDELPQENKTIKGDLKTEDRIAYTILAMVNLDPYFRLTAEQARREFTITKENMCTLKYLYEKMEQHEQKLSD